MFTMCNPVGVLRMIGVVSEIARNSRVAVRLLSLVATDIPQPPTRPLNSYMIFFNDHRLQTKANFPDLSTIEISQKLAGLWKGLDAEDKQKYILQAHEFSEQHQQRMALYRASVTPEELEHLAQQRKEAALSRSKRKVKKEMRKLDRPKRPMSTFSLYIQSKLKNSSGSVSEKMIVLSKDWKTMTETDKGEYGKHAAELMQDYYVAMDQWEERMIDEGKISALRKKSQLVK